MNRQLLLSLLLLPSFGAAQTPTPAPAATPAVRWEATLAATERARLLATLLHTETPLSEDSSLGARRVRLLARIKVEGLTVDIRAKCEAWQTDFLRVQAVLR